MGEPVLVVRVAANIDALRKNLIEGNATIETTKRQMSAMANSFDGSRSISEAGAVMAQIKLLGGVTNLTAAEQSKANRILEEGLAKYQALGREAPPGMRELATATKQVNTTNSSLVDSLKRVALGYATMATVRAGMRFVGDVVAEAGALKDLAQQTHINVEELQVLSGAMSEFGVDSDTLGKALFTLSRKVAGGDASVEKSLAKMGMSLQDLDGLNGQALFLKIEKGLATLQGGIRDDVSAEIFGSKLGMAMAGASEDIEGAIKTWREHNTVMSKETVDSLDEADEAINRLQKSLGAMTGNVMGPVAKGLNAYIALVKDAGVWSATWARFLDSFGSGTAHFDALTKAVKSTQGAAGDWKNVVDAGTDVVIEQTRTLSDAERAWNAMAAAVVDTTASSVVYGDGLPDVTENEKSLLQVLNEITAAQAPLQTGFKFTSVVLDEQAKSLRDVAAAAAAAKAANDAFMNAKTLNDRVNAAQSFNVSPMNRLQTEDVANKFRVAGDSQETALWRALKALESKEGTYAPKDNRAYFDMLNNQTQLAQLRLMLAGQERPPGFKSGVENFAGGLAYVHRDEMLVNMPKGTDVIPAGKGGGAPNVTINLTQVFKGSVISTRAEVREMVSGAILDVYKSAGIPLPSGAGR